MSVDDKWVTYPDTAGSWGCKLYQCADSQAHDRQESRGWKGSAGSSLPGSRKAWSSFFIPKLVAL